MNRMSRILVRLLLVALSCAAGSLAAGQAVVTALMSSDAAAYRDVLDGFKQALADRDVALLLYERPAASETAASLRDHLAEKKPGLVLAVGTRASQLAHAQVRDVPVVFCMVFEADSFTAPNATGVTLAIPAAARVAQLREALPGLRTIGVVYSDHCRSAQEELATACAKAGLALVPQRAQSASELDHALQQMAGRVQCFVMLPDPAIYTPQSVEHVLAQGLDQSFAVVGLSAAYTRAGALLSFDCNYPDLGHQVAELSLRILGGEKPSAIAPAPPQRVDLSLNLSVARRLGIDLPPAARARAVKTFGW